MTAVISPMTMGKNGPIIERTYHASHALQWARELWKNAVEAGASKVVYTTEWEAARDLGVYRRLVWDDGAGMSPQEIVKFMNVYGGGGKPIGAAHENYGVGAKTSLLPWNRNGLVILSLKDGVESMAVLRYDENSEQYGLVNWTFESGKTDVVASPGEYEGVDYSKVLESATYTIKGVKYEDVIHVKGHGTMFILLGNTGKEDTFQGDPNRAAAEATKYAVVEYLNLRIWEVDADSDIFSHEYGSYSSRSKWPTSHEQEQKRHGQARRVVGLLHSIYNMLVWDVKSEGVVAVNTADEECPATVHWFLEDLKPGKEKTDNEKPDISKPGVLSVLYANELYDQTTDGRVAHVVYGKFGVPLKEVRERLWLVIEPEPWDEATKRGVRPDESRSRLLMTAGQRYGSALPIDEWGADFQTKIPKEIQSALDAYLPTSEGASKDKVARLFARYADKWAVTRFLFRQDGTTNSRPVNTTRLKPVGGTSSGTESGTRNGDGKSSRGGRSGTDMVKTLGMLGDEDHSGDTEDPNGKPASPQTRRLDGPDAEWFPASEFADLSPDPRSIFAEFLDPSPKHPMGFIRLNREHPVFLRVLQDWANRQPGRDPAGLVMHVRDCYKLVAIAKVTHALSLRDTLKPERREYLLSPEALTTALLGLFAEEQVIAGSIGQVKKAAAPAGKGS